MRKNITAIPAGKKNGKPITRRYAYVIDREPEPFNEGKVRIFAENRSHRRPGGQFAFTPVVVCADSVQSA